MTTFFPVAQQVFLTFDTELIVSPFSFSGLVWFVCPDSVPFLTESVWLMPGGCRVGFVGCSLWVGT